MQSTGLKVDIVSALVELTAPPECIRLFVCYMYPQLPYFCMMKLILLLWVLPLLADKL